MEDVVEENPSEFLENQSNKSDPDEIYQRESRNDEYLTVDFENDMEMSNVDSSPQRFSGSKSSPNRNSYRSLPKTKSNSVDSRFKGQSSLQYAIYAHYMAYGSASIAFVLGVFALAWMKSQTYGCKISGKYINDIFLINPSTGTCTATYTTPQGAVHHICCDPNSTSSLTGNVPLGIIFILFGIFAFLYEDVDYSYGLWFPTDTYFYNKRISAIGIFYIIIGIIGLGSYVTCFGGFCVITNGIVYCIAAYRKEAGDGGRAQRALKKAAAPDAVHTNYVSGRFEQEDRSQKSFFKRIVDEDKLTSYVWVGVYILLNVILFIVTLNLWYSALDAICQSLWDGSIDIYGTSRVSHANRKMVRYGPISYWAPWAKACGNCLNFNCAIVLFPITKMVLNYFYNMGESFSGNKQDNGVCNRMCGKSMFRYIPLQRNVEFHKIIAFAIFLFGWAHTAFHLINLIFADEGTLSYFRFARWDGFYLFTGALVSYAMFIMYPGALHRIRKVNYELFYYSHHWFILFFVAMFIHGPVFIYWCCVPLTLYIIERILQANRGQPYEVIKVEWISPVLALYFKPMYKEDFNFKEGQYVYINCPAVSPDEWHPMTISSATDDMHLGPRIHLETGEEVAEVPRPPSLPPNIKWNKYCRVSQDWRTMNPNDFIDKSDTGYLDFVSLHIKVFGLDLPEPETWTRRFKEYLEMLSPTSKFPFYFCRRDARGDIVMGRHLGPSGLPLIRIDGPHSAPTEHYSNYGTVMLVGAGIGLTPCASVLCALTKYRWKKNFNPDILHFYWVVRQSEVESYQWFVHMLTDIAFELKRGRESKQIEQRYYLEIHIYITGVDPIPKKVGPLYRATRNMINYGSTPAFSADDLYGKMMNPTVDSGNQVNKMKDPNAINRLQDIWVWKGRPQWDDLFREVKAQRQHSDIGVCFCGSASIGSDLRAMCEKYSSVDDDCLFSLHKENF